MDGQRLSAEQRLNWMNEAHSRERSQCDLRSQFIDNLHFDSRWPRVYSLVV